MIELHQGERMSPLLAKLVEGWKDELATLRAQNDGPLDAERTATLRGRITQIKACIALADEPIVIE